MDAAFSADGQICGENGKPPNHHGWILWGAFQGTTQVLSECFLNKKKCKDTFFLI